MIYIMAVIKYYFKETTLIISFATMFEMVFQDWIGLKARNPSLHMF